MPFLEGMAVFGVSFDRAVRNSNSAFASCGRVILRALR
jgi:hypothetical protein